MQIGEFLKFDYRVDYPVSLLITGECVSKYNKIFFFLLRIKRVNQILKLIWKFTNSSRFKVSVATGQFT